MKQFFICVALILAGCRDTTRLVKVTKCGMPCYTWTIGQPGVGQCKTGLWVCKDDEDDDSAECEGQVGPSREICDGIDNSCDGRVDEGATAFCQTECGTGTATCVDGHAGVCNVPTPSPEVCDGKDNDCDGLIDEPQDLPIEFCYTGPPSTASFGTCHPGTIRCERGVKVCFGDQTPVPEQCDGVDNNCDGRIDEGVATAKPTDIVFIMDDSGSMQSTITSVQDATNQFANTYSTRTDLRWALVTAPDVDPRYDGLVHKYMDFSTAGALASAMRGQMALGGSSEATLDALYQLMDTANPLQMSWRTDSRHVLILFTDEDPQSYASPLVTSADVFARLLTLTNVDIWIFTSSQYNWMDIFGHQYFPGSGIRYLSTDPDNIFRELNTIVKDSTCK